MPKNILKILLGIWSSLLISSCAVTPPDVPLCTEISPSRGYCVNTISSKEFEVNETKKLNGKSWWEHRPLMIYTPVGSWVEIKKFIIKICKKSNMCDGRNITSWKRTVKAIDKAIKSKK